MGCHMTCFGRWVTFMGCHVTFFGCHVTFMGCHVTCSGCRMTFMGCHVICFRHRVTCFGRCMTLPLKNWTRFCVSTTKQTTPTDGAIQK